MKFLPTACLLSLIFHAGVQADEPLTYEKHVRPILKAHCFYCHGEGGELEGKLDLRLRRLIAKGGDSGEAIVPGKPEDSLLLQRIKDKEMPPNKKLVPEKEVAILERWIAQGAVTAAPEPEGDLTSIDITAEEKKFWSFQPIVRPALPVVKESQRVATPIDTFLLAKLEEKGLSFSPEADKRVLIRRAYFDLTGLPPTPQAVAEFVADTAPDAYDRLLDQLLESPQYGERWGRHWLDVAGYADSDGYDEADRVRKFAYKYRDWVIRAMNTDMPYDRFVIEQMAGDELVPWNMAAVLKPEQEELLAATGFLRTPVDGTEATNDKVARNSVISETLKVVSTSLLGLTVGCAECHNHRYDPILQTDYYRLRAIFEPALNFKEWRKPTTRLVSLMSDANRGIAEKVEAEAVAIDKERQTKQEEYIAKNFDKEIAKLAEDKREAARVAHKTPAAQRTPEQIQLFKDFPTLDVNPGTLELFDPPAFQDLAAIAKRAADKRATKPLQDYVSLLNEIPGKVPETFLFHRGDPDQPKQVVPPGELSVIETSLPVTIPVKDPSPTIPTTGRRLAYAKHLVSGKHPLTARVLVNRVWMLHFGKGLVGTPGDFGFLGERPTHPELLDWLADDFMAHGWTLKRVHKLIMTSAAYRQSSQRNPALEAADPDNRLLARMSVRRLEAEAVRDTILAVNGKLNLRQFGSAVPVMEDDVGQIVVGIENKNGENRPGPIIPMQGEEYRRSVYVQVRRSRPLAMLDTFDLPTLDPNCTSRNVSTATPQSLMLMNSDFVLENAKLLAARLVTEAGADQTAQIQLAWQLAFNRAPSAEEQQAAQQFFTEQIANFSAVPTKETDPAKQPDPLVWARTTFCQALFSSNEFLYVD
ncbi:MAG: PSD1 and planctomycete cytochrome C domain-containing protein [Planctomycetota bacterium]